MNIVYKEPANGNKLNNKLYIVILTSTCIPGNGNTFVLGNSPGV